MDTEEPRPERRAGGAQSVEELTRRNVERIQALEREEYGKATTADRVADAIANFVGSILFVWVTVLLIGGWVVGNLLVAPDDRIDSFPFPLLTLVLSIEAIFLAIFILMSQNRAARVSEKRSHLDLQLNLLSEQENTSRKPSATRSTRPPIPVRRGPATSGGSPRRIHVAQTSWRFGERLRERVRGDAGSEYPGDGPAAPTRSWIFRASSGRSIGFQSSGTSR
jgi:uncharacterized membrane protein